MSNAPTIRPYTAGGTIVAGRAVYITGANTVEQGNASGQPCGIALAAAASGESVAVCISGPCLASAGATLTPGTHTFLISDANGLLDPAATDEDIYIARFLGERAAADGDTAVPVFVTIGVYGIV